MKSASYHKLLGIFLAIEIVVVVAVVLIFRTVDSKQVAATVTGSLFVLLGISLLVGTFRSGQPFHQALFWVSALFLFAVAIPMMWVRLSNWGVDFSELRVWGVSAPVFHQQANTAYILMVVATVVDRFRLRHRI